MSQSEPEVSFAFWIDPTTEVKINYSLPLFNEIDFEVNEGYRRIPHGGVEVGGLLYGKVSPKSLTIEAFRSINCEHAAGPSFLLSERDLANLQEAILAAPNDQELLGLEPVGWFIAHTRGPLRMTDREAELFQRFFPEPKRVTVLVKPERFKPTRFAFLIRSAAGSVNPDGEPAAIILPLPGRPGKSASGPAPAIPAPQQIDSYALAKSNPPAAESRTASASGVEAVEPASVPHTPDTLPLQALPSAAPVHPIGASAEIPIPATSLAPSSKSPARQPAGRSRPGALLLILIVAALLGCGAGYWAYLQLPPPVISLRIQKQGKSLLVLWDPAITESSRYIVIRINNGVPTLLTTEQKASGIAQVPLAGDSVKVEIVAQHWARESRGIVRFIPGTPIPEIHPDQTAPAVQAPQ